MGAWEIVTIIFAVAVVAAVVVGSIIRKKKGKLSCCSDCSCCPYHTSCQSCRPADKANSTAAK